MLAGFNFAPRDFATCDGQLLPISQNQALFSLLGTQYGGNGTVTFGQPDLRGRTPRGFSQSEPVGVASGIESVALTSSQVPSHTHAFAGTAARSEEHTSELQSLMRISYAVFCLKKKTPQIITNKIL